MENNNCINKIIQENSTLLGLDVKITKLNVGFTNEVYNIDDKYILKICGSKQNEERFQSEIQFYLNNINNPYIPSLFKYFKSNDDEKRSYEIIEKLKGNSLYYFWHRFDNNKRKQIIEEISLLMKSFHSKKGHKYDWSKYVTDKINKNLDICFENNILSSSEYELGKKILKVANRYLGTTDFSLVHSDIHFDNLIYCEDNKIRIIDFETSIYAPIDYELDIFLRMCRNPFKYASEETEKYIKLYDYQEIETQLKEYYPLIFEVKNFDIRMMYYDLETNIRILPKFSEDLVLKNNVIEIINRLYNKVNN